MISCVVSNRYRKNMSGRKLQLLHFHNFSEGILSIVRNKDHVYEYKMNIPVSRIRTSCCSNMFHCQPSSSVPWWTLEVCRAPLVTATEVVKLSSARHGVMRARRTTELTASSSATSQELAVKDHTAVLCVFTTVKVWVLLCSY